MQQHLSTLPRATLDAAALLRAMLVAMALAAAAATASAGVSILVEAGSNAGGLAATADNYDNQLPPNGSIHGVAEGTRDVATAFTADGAAGPCDFFQPVSGCAFTLPQSRAMVEVRGDLGRVRAAVYASADYSAGVGSGVARVEAAMVDVIQAPQGGDLLFNLHLDLDVHFDGIPSTRGDNIFELGFSLQPFIAGAGATPTVFEYVLPWYEGGHHVIDRSFQFLALPADAQVVMNLSILASNDCSVNLSEEGGTFCSIWTDAGNTAYIGVVGDYVSASGYAYPGFAAQVPEPASAGLIAAGLCLLGTRRRRGARH